MWTFLTKFPELGGLRGALLLIDAAQGVEAQTVANANLAVEQDLVIIPVINKIDLPSANLDLCLRQLEDLIAIPSEEAILASAKNGVGIEEILNAISERIPPPRWADYPAIGSGFRLCLRSVSRGDHLRSGLLGIA